VFVGLFRLLLIALALIEDGKFISVYGYCCNLSGGVAIHHERDVREEQHRAYTWREQAIIE